MLNEITALYHFSLCLCPPLPSASPAQSTTLSASLDKYVCINNKQKIMPEMTNADKRERNRTMQFTSSTSTASAKNKERTRYLQFFSSSSYSKVHKPFSCCAHEKRRRRGKKNIYNQSVRAQKWCQISAAVQRRWKGSLFQIILFVSIKWDLNGWSRWKYTLNERHQRREEEKREK